MPESYFGRTKPVRIRTLVTGSIPVAATIPKALRSLERSALGAVAFLASGSPGKQPENIRGDFRQIRGSVPAWSRSRPGAGQAVAARVGQSGSWRRSRPSPSLTSRRCRRLETPALKIGDVERVRMAFAVLVAARQMKVHLQANKNDIFWPCFCLRLRLFNGHRNFRPTRGPAFQTQLTTSSKNHR